MSSTADRGTHDPRRDFGDFAVELDTVGIGSVDPELCHRLWTECAGRARFAEAVLRAAAAAGVSVDPESTAFADWVVELCPRLSLALGSGDTAAASVLAQLSAVSETTAVRALTAVADDLLGGIGIHDPEGVLIRLRSSGILTRFEDSARGTLLKVPTLIAAKLRHDLRAEVSAEPVVASLLDVLVDHMESAGLVEPELLSDVLLLARHGGHWSQLLRVCEAVGMPMFLLTPRTSCTVLRVLPLKARTSRPGLAFFGSLAEDITADAADDSPARIRAAVIRHTGPGMLRSRLPGKLGDSELNVEKEESRPGEMLVDVIGTVWQLIRLADAGRHGEAAELGIRASAEMRSARARSVVRLLTAIALHHAAEPRRALSVLNEIEGPARAGHVEGDFLLPSIIAWTALIAAVSGDHERADAHLAESDAPSGISRAGSEADPAAAPADSPPTVIIDELVTPPLRIASALRALDRLDLERAEAEFGALSAYPEMRTLWVYLPLIARTLAVLSAEAESGLLFVNDDAQRFQDSGVLSDAEKDLIALGRSTVFIALGQLRWAEIDRDRLSPACDGRIVLDVRSKLVAGRNDEAISCADTWFYHHSLSPRSRAELAAVRAAAKLRTGDETGAQSDFRMAVSLSTWVSSLLPIALLPLPDRSRLIDLTTDSPVWADAANEFSATFASPAQLVEWLRSIGPVSVDIAETPQLNAGEAQLIDLLARGLSVAEIAEELNQVTGTVKNRLSALYRKFGVSNRADVLIRARSFGYLA
ncbi:response regulator transcription factor [Brevibacterium linens]|uniref:Regulatory protein, luxR family n=1 Tax=Brevibacterium linens TaxID=1703 RepID=A0A2H1JTY6_BRELN|nr:helix-turn-helix transcriptional regulator [Brevibacterium linens]SMX90929.1 regulatory protein, luxR family [Brevibacterium linens]